MQHCNTKCDTKIFVIFKNSNILHIISNTIISLSRETSSHCFFPAKKACNFETELSCSVEINKKKRRNRVKFRFD